MLKRWRLVLLAAAAAPALTGCGSPSRSLAITARLVISGEFVGGLNTARPLNCGYKPGYPGSVFDIVGTVEGHILELHWEDRSPAIEGDAQAPLPGGRPIATADPVGNYPGGDQYFNFTGGSAELVDELTTERHWLGGTIHVDHSRRSGTLDLSDSQLHVAGTWAC
jgi:hypothetical protein